MAYVLNVYKQQQKCLLSPRAQKRKKQLNDRSSSTESGSDGINSSSCSPSPSPYVVTATPGMCHFCFDTIIDVLQQRNRPPSSQIYDSPEVVDVSVQCPIFVTWETFNSRASSSDRQWQLRGCIGTLSPKLLVTSISEYAILAAFKDRRFRPVGIQELSNMRVAVSLLVNYQVCNHVYDWEIGVHGILIKFEVQGRHYNATYLPEVAKEQGWNHSETVTSLIQKAGYQRTVSSEMLPRIHCTRYESSKCRLTYDEYKMSKGGDPDALLEFEHPQASTCTNM